VKEQQSNENLLSFDNNVNTSTSSEQTVNQTHNSENKVPLLLSFDSNTDGNTNTSIFSPSSLI